jgi:CRP/FNR family transcriptional regulator, cyclic AMP receptor protein
MYSIKAPATAHAPHLRDVFERHTLATTRVRLDGQRTFYANGDDDDSLYLIEDGQVKLSMASAEGKDCLLGIHGAGEVFGELCFTGTRRTETATAMTLTTVRRATRRDVIAELQRTGAIDLLLRHLGGRLAERQMAVFELITTDSRRRLAKVLLDFAEKLGVGDGSFLRLEKHISHEELSQIVGTTRPRITAFMQEFRKMGVIQTSGRSISVHRAKTISFLARE